MTPTVDFHCHLDLFPDFEAVVAECEARRVYTLAVTTTPYAWQRNQDLCAPTRYVRPALGLHPQLVGQRPRDLDRWLALLPEARYIGEVGLDASPAHFSSLDRQKAVFTSVLQECSVQGGKVLSVHSVRTATIVLDLMEEFLPGSNGAVVLHWFSGSAREARRAVELGCMFSVNARMLAGERGRSLVRSLPVDRLLTETDGPFTEGIDGPMRPREVGTTLRRLAECIGYEEHQLHELLLRNLGGLVGGIGSDQGVLV